MYKSPLKPISRPKNKTDNDEGLFLIQNCLTFIAVTLFLVKFPCVGSIVKGESSFYVLYQYIIISVRISVKQVLDYITRVAACSWVCTSMYRVFGNTGFFIRPFLTKITQVTKISRYNEAYRAHMLNYPQARILIFCNLAPEGRRDFIFSLKWPQWPRLKQLWWFRGSNVLTFWDIQEKLFFAHPRG